VEKGEDEVNQGAILRSLFFEGSEDFLFRRQDVTHPEKAAEDRIAGKRDNGNDILTVLFEADMTGTDKR
jgi:hypothetical protein